MSRYIVAGEDDENTPVQDNAEKYHRLIETSQLHLFDEHVGHYVFLNVPTEFGKRAVPELAIDKPSVDRKQIHQKTWELALDFFKNSL